MLIQVPVLNLKVHVMNIILIIWYMDRIVSYGIFSLFDRSSQDDYCPPDQVESIQNSVLEILQDLYLEIELTVDYE